MNRKSKFLIYSLIVIITSVFFGGILKDYLKDKAISSNSSIIDAKIIDSKMLTKRKKGVKIISYFFTYEFDVNGKKYTGKFDTNESSAKSYLDKGVVSIMYNKDNPNKKDLTCYVDTEKTFLGLFWSGIKASIFGVFLGFIFGIILSLKFGWLKNDENIVETSPKEEV